jgi:hypothetical protein
MRRAPIALLLLAGLAAGHARPAAAASSEAQTSQRQWNAMDKCNQQAFRLYPDYTAAGAQQRDRYVRRCQREAGAPVQGGAGAVQTPAAAPSSGQ